MALHVDYEIRWKNFKAFRDTGWIRIRPLTVVIGANNSGKSSLIAPLLVMSQTLASRDQTSPIISRGPLTDLGNFTNIIHNHDRKLSVCFGFRFHTHDVMPSEKIEEVGGYPPGAIELEFSEKPDAKDVSLTKIEVQDIYKRPFLSRKIRKDGKYSIKYHAKANLNNKEKTAIFKTKPSNFLFSPSSIIHTMLSSSRDKSKAEKDFSPSFSQFLNIIGYSFEEMRYILTNISYIGPLRERPRRYYESMSEVPRTVGIRGEKTANLVRRKLSSIRSALNNWVSRFEFGDEIDVNEISDDVFSIEFSKNGSKLRTNIADAGFGASQVLPLVVQSATAPYGSLTIAEQPEIHLNPKLQVVLADLFTQMAKDDHRVIVETHSEHLLLRLRYLIAKGEIDHKLVALYFVEKKEGEANIREIPLESDGHISNQVWPTGFFEEGLKTSLALATAQHFVKKK